MHVQHYIRNLDAQLINEKYIFFGLQTKNLEEKLNAR
jgi:hypothetical protein